MIMPDFPSAPDRRAVLTASAAAGAFTMLGLHQVKAAETSATPRENKMAKDAIRPFHVEFPQDALVDLRKRVAATRWPEKETVADATQGVQLATTQKLASYWATQHDWR